jgi:ATP-dependent Clp protease protease subunit
MNWTGKSKHRMHADDEDEPSFQPMYQIMGNGSTAMRVVENTIFFYDDVTNESILDLNRVLTEVDVKLQNTRNILGDSFDPTIRLRVKTDGGDLHSVLSTVDIIHNLKSKVYTYIDGSVASAGSMITLSGDRRFMGKHAIFLIHQLSSGMYGKYTELEDSMENCANMMKFLKAYYKENTKIPMKKLDELLKRDLYLSVDECLLYGIVDEVF